MRGEGLQPTGSLAQSLGPDTRSLCACWLAGSRAATEPAPVQRKREESATGFRGVKLQRGRFRARLSVGGKQVDVGIYDAAEDAARAYDK